MECLKYKTPKESFAEELKEIEMKKTANCGIMSNSILLEESVRIQGCV